MQSKPASRTRRTPPAPRRSPQGIPTSSGAIFSRNTLRAYLYTLAIALGAILILSLGVYFHPDPGSLVHPLGYVAAALTAFFGGLIAGKLHGGAPAVCGLVNGILLACTMLLLSFFFLSESSGYSAIVSTLLHSAVPLLSFFGALVGVKRKSPATSKRRRAAFRR